MTEKEINNKASTFYSRYAPKGISLSTLKSAVKKLGFTLIEFSHACNSENVQLLIDSLGLSEMTCRSKGFTYVTSNYRLVFLHEDLTENEKIVVLCHEIGHIYLGHIKPETPMSSSVLDEYEANSFCYKLLHPTSTQKAKTFIKRHTGAVVASICALLILVSVIIFVTVPKNNAAPNSNTVSAEYNPKKYDLPEDTIFHDTYWICDTGYKFHTESCGFVKENPKSRPMTLEEFESESYEPCAKCLKELWVTAK